MITRRKLVSAAAIVGFSAPAFAIKASAAQPPRHVGIIFGTTHGALGESELKTVRAGLKDLGWTEGANLRLDVRWANGDVSLMHRYAAELVASAPDVILCNSTPLTGALLRQSQTTPIVFVVVTDPIGAGFIKTIARPGGNATGLTNFEASMAGKWLQILKEIMPTARQAGLLFNPDTAPDGGDFFLKPFATAAGAFALKPVALSAPDASAIESRIAAFAREPAGGLIVTPDLSMAVHGKDIITLAARLRLPAIYPYRFFATDGGLISYGVDILDLFHRSAAYIDRILRGAKPAELPVEAPTKFQLVINLKTASAQGITIPASLLAEADEVIE